MNHFKHNHDQNLAIRQESIRKKMKVAMQLLSTEIIFEPGSNSVWTTRTNRCRYTTFKPIAPNHVLNSQVWHKSKIDETLLTKVSFIEELRASEFENSN